jgi:hypothetical protein
MSAVEEKLRASIVDHEILESAGLVVYVIDIWRGDKNDPAVAVERYYGLWDAEGLVSEDGEAITPTISMGNYDRFKQTPEAIKWEKLETVKAADKEAEQFKRHHDNQMDEGGYAWGEAREQKYKYQQFMRALDILAADEDNEEAWAAVKEYRDYQALKHEK